jgi:putative two-component system response regulator
MEATKLADRQEKANILVVDDERLVRRAIVTRLKREGYSCEEASNADEAIERLRSNSADLIILDIKMPGMSGIDLLPEIRNFYPNTAVVMSTAIAENNVIIQCMKNGAQDYIIKPFNLDEVVVSVERVLHIRKLELELKEHQQHLEEKVKEQTKQIRDLFLGSIESLVFALEAKDIYTAGHSQRVTKIAVAIGEELGLPRDELEDLRWGAMLHDVGKIAVDPAIQNKPDILTPDEYRHVMTHSYVGAGIVKPVASDKTINIIRHHHDRYDGSGLNQTVRGEQIPLGARIVALADTFDAMTSDRPYRRATSAKAAIEEIQRCSGTQFDPEVVAAFMKLPIAESEMARL